MQSPSSDGANRCDSSTVREGRQEFSFDLTVMSICFCFVLRFPDRISPWFVADSPNYALGANRLDSECQRCRSLCKPVRF
jgi:hypothetical protein